MTGPNQLNRTIEACRRAGLPVVEPADCTCTLRGRLVVIARAGGLRVVWPYEQRCAIHARGSARIEGLRSRPGVPSAAVVTAVGAMP